MAERVHHPRFDRLYIRMASRRRSRGEDEYRRSLLAGLSGRVIEVGAGNRLNFPLYPETVAEVVGDPPHIRRRPTSVRASAHSQIAQATSNRSGVPPSVELHQKHQLSSRGLQTERRALAQGTPYCVRPTIRRWEQMRSQAIARTITPVEPGTSAGTRDDRTRGPLAGVCGVAVDAYLVRYVACRARRRGMRRSRSDGA